MTDRMHPDTHAAEWHAGAVHAGARVRSVAAEAIVVGYGAKPTFTINSTTRPGAPPP